MLPTRRRKASSAPAPPSKSRNTHTSTPSGVATDCGRERARKARPTRVGLFVLRAIRNNSHTKRQNAGLVLVTADMLSLCACYDLHIFTGALSARVRPANT